MSSVEVNETTNNVIVQPSVSTLEVVSDSPENSTITEVPNTVIVAPIQRTVTVTSPGPQGVGLPSGGTAGQVAKKASNTNYDIEWADEGASVPVDTEFTYNLDGSIDTIVAGGVTTEFTYNLDGSIDTISNGTWTKVYNYNIDGSIESITVS